jgi:hypothetical protein
VVLERLGEGLRAISRRIRSELDSVKSDRLVNLTRPRDWDAATFDGVDVQRPGPGELGGAKHLVAWAGRAQQRLEGGEWLGERQRLSAECEVGRLATILSRAL